MFKNYKFYLLVLPTILLSFFILFLGYSFSGGVYAQSNGKGSEIVCPDGGDWHKIDVPEDNEDLPNSDPGPNLITYTAAEGKVVVEVCIKGGREDTSPGGYRVFRTTGDWYQREGQNCVRAFGLGEQVANAERNKSVRGTVCADISHASFRTEVAPPPAPTPKNISPIFECWEPDPENEERYIAYFGWENKSGVVQTIPYGEHNEITPNSYQNYFPTYFGITTNGPRTGRTPFYPNAAIKIANWNGNNIVWNLTDQGTATAGLKGPRCPEIELEPSWTLSKTVGEQCVVIEGETYAEAKYTITIMNTGEGDGYIVELVDILDSKVLEEYIEEILGGGTFDNGEIVWNFGEGLNIESGNSEIFTYTILIPEGAYGTYTNTATAYTEKEYKNGLLPAFIENGFYDEAASDSVEVELECEIEEEPTDENGDDEGEVGGVTDKREEGEVLGTSIVYAQTDGGANLIVYIVEYILVILSGFGIKFVGKKYLTV